MVARLPWGAVLWLLAISLAAANAVGGEYSNRLNHLAAQQDLYDEVCIAMADGSINTAERASILQFAKENLPPQEYQGFKQWINRLSPPKPLTPQQLAKKQRASAKAASYAAQKAKQSTKTMPRPMTTATTQPKGSADDGLVMPTGVLLPDHMPADSVVR